MAKYGLQRGIRGSEARHTTTAQYYRDLKRQTGELEANVRQLQTAQQQAERQLDEVRKEIKSEKLEAAKTEAKTALVAKVGSLLGSGKLKELEADNRTLQSEVAARDENIELLQRQMQRKQEEHKRKFKTERAGFQVVKDPKDKSKLALAINRQLIGEWFKEQFNKLFSSIRRTVAPHRKDKGLGL